MLAKKKTGTVEQSLRQALLIEVIRKVALYFCIGLLVVVLMGPVYFESLQAVRVSLDRQINDAMEANARMLSSSLNDLDASVGVLMEEDSMTYLAYLSDEDGRHVANAIRLSKAAIKALSLKSTLISDYIILIPNSDLMVSGTGVIKKNGYYSRIVDYASFDTVEAYEHALFEERQLVFPLQKIYTRTIGRETNALTLNYYSRTSVKVYSVVSAIITEKTLQDILLPKELQEYGYLTLSLPSGENLVSFGNHTADMFSLGTLDIENGRFKLEYGLSDRYYAQQVQSVEQLIFFYSILAMGITLLISIAFAHRSLKPYHRMVNIVKQLGTESAFESRNINEIIYNALSTTVSQVDILERDLNKALEKHKKELVLSLINGTRRLTDDEMLILRDEKTFSAEYILCKLVLDDELVMLSQPQKDFLSAMYQRIGRSMVGSLVLSQHPFFAVVPYDAGALSTLEAFMGQFAEEGMPAQMAVSGVNAGLENLHTAYIQLRAVTKNKHLLVRDYDIEPAVLRYDDLPSHFDTDEISMVNAVDTDFVNLLKRGDEEEVEQRLKRLCSQLDKISLTQPQRFSAYYYAVIGVYEKLYSSLEIEMSFPEYEAEASAAEIENDLCCIARDLRKRLQEKRSSSTERHQSIIAYIDQHFTDSQLSLSMLADRFQLSEAYVSRNIKLCTNMSYSAYVEQLRMEKARELLLSNECKVGDVGELLGYDNVNTFYKAFKRYYKVSPGAYRADHGTME